MSPRARQNFQLPASDIFSRVHATLQPALSVGRSVGWSVGRSNFTFFMILLLWPHCSCPNSLVTSNMALAHLHATSVAVYPALFSHHFSYIASQELRPFLTKISSFSWVGVEGRNFINWATKRLWRESKFLIITYCFVYLTCHVTI